MLKGAEDRYLKSWDTFARRGCEKRKKISSTAKVNVCAAFNKSFSQSDAISANEHQASSPAKGAPKKIPRGRAGRSRRILAREEM